MFSCFNTLDPPDSVIIQQDIIAPPTLVAVPSFPEEAEAPPGEALDYIDEPDVFDELFAYLRYPIDPPYEGIKEIQFRLYGRAFMLKHYPNDIIETGYMGFAM